MYLLDNIKEMKLKNTAPEEIDPIIRFNFPTSFPSKCIQDHMMPRPCKYQGRKHSSKPMVRIHFKITLIRQKINFSTNTHLALTALLHDAANS